MTTTEDLRLLLPPPPEIRRTEEDIIAYGAMCYKLGKVNTLLELRRSLARLVGEHLGDLK